jgi:hypothetical protein
MEKSIKHPESGERLASGRPAGRTARWLLAAALAALVPLPSVAWLLTRPTTSRAAEPAAVQSHETPPDDPDGCGSCRPNSN